MQAHEKTLTLLNRASAFLLLSILASCQYFQQKNEVTDVLIAQANEARLYASELEGLIPEDATTDDSIILTQKYVDSWIRKQLMIDQAQRQIDVNLAEIDRKLLEYRYSLIIHEFEKYYIDSNLNGEVSDDEIQSYYAERSENFLLKQNIVRCVYAKIPKGSPGLSTFRRNVRAYPNSNLEDIREYCFQNALDAFIDEDVWVNFSELANATPLKDVKNEAQFLETTTFSATSDDEFIYYLRILEYKVRNELSPLEFVRENIENIIINKRKIELKKDLEERIYNEAKANNSFQIYSR